MMNGFGGGMGIGMGIGWLFWLLVIGGVIWAVVQITPRTTQHRDSGGSSVSRETPLEILDKRYARGEISRSQLKKMRKQLEMN